MVFSCIDLILCYDTVQPLVEGKKHGFQHIKLREPCLEHDYKKKRLLA
jgi:hypothetical protein